VTSSACDDDAAVARPTLALRNICECAAQDQSCGRTQVYGRVMPIMVLDSLSRRMRAMHSLWEDAVGSMTANHVNHVERVGVLPIAFSLFHFTEIEDGSVAILGGPPPTFDQSWADRIGLAIVDNGKARTVEEMSAQRIGHYDAFCDYQRTVFDKTENWLATLDDAALDELVIRRPFPDQIASTYSARVAGDEGIRRLDALECWIYQHGLRHMGEVEHARALVGLHGMTS
jgi:hypothetical protein